MMIDNIDIANSFRQLGVLPNEWVMIHGDGGVASQFQSIQPHKRIHFMQNQIVDYMNDGTIIVPTYSYSFTKGQNFDVNHTPSSVGQFSEMFRRLPFVQRTRHPIFSVAVTGKGSKSVLNASIEDCFGKGTFFDLLQFNNAKIVCLGCDLSRITFVHYVEQLYGVSYRYPKVFSGLVIEGEKYLYLKTQYLVRDLKIKSSCDLGFFKEEAIERGVLKVGEIGRFPIQVISTRDFISLSFELLDRNEYALIEAAGSNNEV